MKGCRPGMRLAISNPHRPAISCRTLGHPTSSSPGLTAGDVHLLLTDMVMPGKNGRELARELAARSPAFKTIFVSGYGKNTVLLAAESDPNIFYLAKRFSVPSLIQKVEFALTSAGQPAGPES